MPPRPNRRARLRARAHVAACGLVLAVGCRGRDTNPPRHYEDPKAMIATFEADSRDAWQMPDRVVRSLPIRSRDAVVADIGAGSGYFTRRLAVEVSAGKVYAIDVDSEFEDYVRDHHEAWGTPNVEPRLAHYDDPMLPQGGIDLVFTSNTYAYIRDRTAYFAKVRAALKPGGYLVIIDFRPTATPPETSAPDPRYRVAEATVVAEVTRAGFELERSETFLPHQYFLVFRRVG